MQSLLNWQIETHNTLPSTQDEILARIQQDIAQEGLVICTENQTQGRGRHGRVWEAGTGNLYLTLLLSPRCSPTLIGQLSLITGLALAKTIEKSVQEKPNLKWPNDVLLKGKKCAGILPDTTLSKDNKTIEWLALGIGLNVNTAPLETSCALQNFAKNTLDTKDILSTLLEEISNTYTSWQTNGFQELKQEWLNYALGHGEAISVKTPQEKINGYFDTIDDSANLILRDQNKNLIRVTAGEVLLV